LTEYICIVSIFRENLNLDVLTNNLPYTSGDLNLNTREIIVGFAHHPLSSPLIASA